MATTVEKIYKLDIQGADSVNELKTAIEELNDKLKTLNATSQEYKDTLAQLTEYQSKLADAMKGISDSSQTTNESLNGIKETVDGVAESISALGDGVASAFTEGLAQGMAEAAAETLQMGDSMDKGINSVKGLKQEISDLRDKLVTLENGSDEYKATVQELIEAQVKLKEVMNAGKNEMQAADGSYNALTQRMAALKQVWRETTDEATRNEIGQQIAEINTQLKGMDASIGNFQRNVGNYKSALDGLDGSFVNLKTQLRECKEAMQQLDPASQAYADAMARAAEITHQLSEQQEQIKYASTDFGDQLENVRGIASNLAAGYSAVNAAMGLFGEENEEVQQAMLKVQQAMALVQGLQGIDGFIKRTKGLSQSMGLVTKATQANTVATKANATASKADAVAKGAETVATKAAVPAQLSLNAAMKANPIGFIIGLIATLVTAMVLLKDKIMEMIGSSKDMSAAFDKVKAVLSGVGNVIKKSVINPIKMAIIPIKTLAKVMIDLFKGDWSKIGDDIKEGFTEMKDNVVDTINVVGAFKEGYDKKVAEQNEAARKAEAAAREKELDNIIKDNEAKYGSDWKYTEEAQKLYGEMFKVRMAQYKEDSDEYREAQRDKMAYDRELAEKQQEEEDKKNAEAKKKAEAAAKEAEQRRKKQLSDFKSAFEKYMPSWDKYTIDISNMFEKWTSGVEEFSKELAFSFVKAGDTIEEALEKTQSIVSSMYVEWQKSIWNDLYGKEWNANLDRLFYNMDRKTQAYLKKRNQMFQEEKVKFGIEFPTDELSNFYAIYNMTKQNITKEQEELEKVLGKFYSKALKDSNILIGLIDKESDVLGEHLVENIQYYIGVYNMAIEAAASGNAELSADYMKAFEDNMSAIMNADFNKEALEKALGEYLSEFQKMLDKRNQLANDAATNDLEYFTKSADIYEKVYAQKLQKYSNQVELMSKQRESLFDQEFNNAMRWQGVYDNAIRDLYDNRDYLEESYQLQIGYYTKIRDAYIEMSQDMELTNEQRENAAREAQKVTTQIMEEEMSHQTEMIKIQKQLIKEWTNALKDAASGIGDILSSVSDYYEGVMELEKAKIDQDLEDGKISEEQAKARYALMKDEWQKSKNLQLAMTWINGFSAAIGAYQSMASIPYVGPVLGAVAAAAALATTAVQAAKIEQTTFDNPYGGGGGSSSSASIQLPDVMEYEPNMGRNLTGMDDTDELNNDGSGRGRGDMRVYVVESDISSALDKSNKRKTEVTF